MRAGAARTLVLLAYGHTSGSVVSDPSLPVRDVEAAVSSMALSYGRTFGRSASAGFVVPYLWGAVEGAVGEERRRVTRSGLGDARLRLSVNVIGGRAPAPRAFAVRTPGTTLGMSLVAVVPSGQYDASKPVNLGANRWAVTLSLPVGRRSSLKLAWATGFTTSIGGDFDTLSLAWQTLWFSGSDKP